MGEKSKIRIIKCSDPMYWYQCMEGVELTVIQSKRHDCYTVVSFQHENKRILKDDCQVIQEFNCKCKAIKSAETAETESDKHSTILHFLDGLRKDVVEMRDDLDDKIKSLDSTTSLKIARLDMAISELSHKIGSIDCRVDNINEQPPAGPAPYFNSPYFEAPFPAGKDKVTVNTPTVVTVTGDESTNCGYKIEFKFMATFEYSNRSSTFKVALTEDNNGLARDWWESICPEERNYIQGVIFKHHHPMRTYNNITIQ